MLSNRPPMGWNSWNTFAEKITEDIIISTAEKMVEDGYRDCGYEYVVIDDCWSLKERDENGRLVANPAKFPHGIKFLSDHIHALGLKFGMYSCAGVRTCADYPSSYGHEFVDAKTFAEWGVDFLKYDFCHFPKTANCKNAYLTMSLALRASGRDILFSACNWGVEDPAKWMRSVGAHMFRSTGDIVDNFKSFKDIYKMQADNFFASAPGCYNDIDMLVVGMYGMGNVGIEKGCTDTEYKTHFSLWCLFGAPLMIGGDINNLNKFSKELLQNKELIRINQDEECRPPYEIKNEGDTYTYLKILSDNEFILAFFNMGDNKQRVFGYFKDAGLPYYTGLGFEMTDIFTGENIGVKKDYYSVDLEAHDVAIFKARISK